MFKANPIVIIDSREKKPLVFDVSIRKQLKYGDYSMMGYRDKIQIERKSLDDLARSLVGQKRIRFESTIKNAIVNLKFYALVVESNYDDLEDETMWKCKATSNVIKGTLLKWSVKYGFPVYFAGARKGATDLIDSILKGFSYYN